MTERSRSNTDIFGYIARRQDYTDQQIKVRESRDRSLPDWIEPAALLNSWANTGSANNRASYWKDAAGIVHLKGAIGGGTPGVGTGIVFILPVGFRPGFSARFAITCNAAFGYAIVYATGDVEITGGSGTAVHLAPISFRPEG